MVSHPTSSVVFLNNHSQRAGFDPAGKCELEAELRAFEGMYDPATSCVIQALNAQNETVIGGIVVDGGGLSAATDGAHFRWYWLHPSAFNKGVSHRIIDAAICCLVSAGFTKAWFTTDVGPEFKVPQQLWRDHGFQKDVKKTSLRRGKDHVEDVWIWSVNTP